jgi:hypothetical protein
MSNVVFEEEPVADSDRVLVPNALLGPTPVIEDNIEIIPDIVPVKDINEIFLNQVHPQILRASSTTLGSAVKDIQ